MGRAYIVTAALSFFGIASNEEMPAKNTLPPHISAQSEENNKIYFEEVLGKFSYVYLLQKTAITDGEEYVKNYALHVFHLSYHPHFATERHGSRSRWRKKPYRSEITSLCLQIYGSIQQIYLRNVYQYCTDGLHANSTPC